MSEIYRKSGRSVRYEHGVLVHTVEAGEAIEDNGIFTCRPAAHAVELPPVDTSVLQRTVAAIGSLIAHPLSIERLVVSEGVAEHWFGGRRWAEVTRRIHLSVTSGSLRVLIDAGDYDLSDIAALATALPRCTDEREITSPVRLAPAVTAALLPSLVGNAPPNITLQQTAGGTDGKGQPIMQCDVSMPPFPNWYRPSYRSRPMRAPFNLRAESSVVEIDESLPRAIALLAPPASLVLRVLCEHRGDVFPATVRVARIDAVARESRWYPYGAGSFGAEMML